MPGTISPSTHDGTPRVSSSSSARSASAYRDDRGHAHAQVEGLVELALRDLPGLAEDGEDRRRGPGTAVEDRVDTPGSERARLAVSPPPVMWA